MNQLIYKNPTLRGGDSLMDYCLSNLFYDPPTLDRNNYWANETDNTIELEVDIPGFKKSEIEIDYKDNYLSIKATQKNKDDKSRQFERYFKIPNIDIKKSTANLINGVLNLSLEKQTSAKTQTLTIN